uniref:Uncharacterized protein n=1 Tax=Lygus hesperus TaxID=30085 RepID=A0A146M4P2_LYGHE
MKASLIIVLVALYGACAQDSESSEEHVDASSGVAASGHAAAGVAVSASASSSSDMGAKVQAALDSMTDLTHQLVKNGTNTFSSTLGSALEMGTGIVGKAAEMQQKVVGDLTTGAKNFADKGIAHMSKMQASLQSTPFGIFLNPYLAMKIQGWEMAKKGIDMAGKVETAKGALMANVANAGAGALREGANVAANLALSGSASANSLSKDMNQQIGAGVSGLLNAGRGFSSKLSAGFSG